jgi:hypothetical protein
VNYALLIYYDEDHWRALDDEQHAHITARYMSLMGDMQAAGAVRDGARLDLAETGRIVRSRSGEALVADGPYTETKEQLGGYWVVDCETLDEAIAWAARIPAAEYGAIEIRPLVG